jgi:hypothetical protein
MEVLQPSAAGAVDGGRPARSRSTDAEEIFGRTREGLPLWFKPERFLEPDFDAEAFVADLRRFVRTRRNRAYPGLAAGCFFGRRTCAELLPGRACDARADVERRSRCRWTR